MIRRFLSIFATLCLLSGVAEAQQPAEPPDDPQAEALLGQAEKLYEAMEYEKTLQILVQVPAAKGASPIQKARAFLYMGVCFTALGRAEDAVQAFISLLKLRNDFRLPDGVSPSIQAMFQEALGRLQKAAAAQQGAQPGAQPGTQPGAQPGTQPGAQPGKQPGAQPGTQPGAQPGHGQPHGQAKQPGAATEAAILIKAKAPQESKAGAPVEVKLTLIDPDRLAKLLLVHWRLFRGPDYSTVKVKVKPGKKKYIATIPAITLPKEKKSTKLLYFVQAADGDGEPVGQAAAMDDPYKVKIVPGAEGGGSWKWWLIGIGAGLAVAGGVVAAVLLTQGDDAPTGPLPDSVTSIVVFR